MSQDAIDGYPFLVFSLLLAPRERVAAGLRDVLGSHGMLENFELSTGPLDLASACIGEPPAGGAHLKRVVLFAPKSAPAVTVFVPNMQDGWQTMINCLSRELQCACLRILVADKDQEFPTVSVEYLVGGEVQRVVFVQKDDEGWKFVQKGVPLSFESTNSYKRRLIRDRLSRKCVVDLLQRGGWDITRREFWQTSDPATYAFERSRIDKESRGTPVAGRAAK